MKKLFVRSEDNRFVYILSEDIFMKPSGEALRFTHTTGSELQTEEET